MKNVAVNLNANLDAKYPPEGLQPVELTEKQKQLCYDLAMDGRPFSAMARALKIRPVAFCDYRLKNPLFDQCLKRYREQMSHDIVDGLVEEMRAHPDSRTARNIFHAVQYVASVKNRKDYGPKMDINVNKQIDISLILDQAESRIAGTVKVIDTNPVHPLLGVKQDPFDDLL